MFPDHPITFHLREKIISSATPDPEAVIELLKSEITAHPKDATLHARLLKHYLQHNRYTEAFEHACNVEFSGNLFFNNFAWYETLNEVLKQQPPKEIKSWQYNLLLLTVHEHLCQLSITETPSGNSKSLAESNKFLCQYDQSLELVTRNGPPTGFSEFHSSLLQHHRGQFAFHSATFLLKKAKKDQLTWFEATTAAAPLMLFAWHTAPLDINIKWLSLASDIQQASVRRWYLEGSYRCSQCGHYLLANSQTKKTELLDQISQFCSGTHWKDKLYKKIFTNPEHLEKIKSSHFVSNEFNDLVLELPNRAEVEAYDAEAQKYYANSLHHFIWILINYKDISAFKCTIFDMLMCKSKNYLICGPESLNKLDVFAFLYSSTLTAKQVLTHNTNNLEIPPCLPANITDMLCSLAQMKWWDCAYKFCQNELSTDLTDIRTTLTRGIEVVRCVDNHGLDPELLYKLGNIFAECAKYTKNSVERNSFSQRAGLYYSTAIPLLQKLKKKAIIVVPEKRMFDYIHGDLTINDLNLLIENSKLFMGALYLNENKFDKAVDMLNDLQSPKASFYLSQTYKKMALEEYKIDQENISQEVKQKCITLLNKSKKHALKTLHKLQNKDLNKNDLYIDTQELLEDIETCLNKFQFSDINDSNTYFTDRNNSSGDGDEHTLQINSHNYRNLNSTPKYGSLANLTNYKSAIESQLLDNTRVEHKVIDKIDNQIQSLQKRDIAINNFMEQTKNWIEENRSLGNQIILSINTNIQNTIEQFKLLKLSVDQVKDQISECKSQCKDVVDLKKEVDELKKEINRLKNMSSEPAMDENHLFNVDQYRNNDNTSTFAARLPLSGSQMMPPFNPRLLQAFPMSLAPYPFCNQNLYNYYSQLNQAHNNIPGAPPIYDPSRAQVNFPGVYPAPEQMYADMAHLIPPVVLPTVPPVPPVPSSIPTTTSKPTQQTNVVNKEPKLPVNVVITSSDPLPTCTTVPTPVLSVTIPPEHIKSTPHNYQIQMPNETRISNAVCSSTTPLSFTWNQTNDVKITQCASSGIKVTPTIENSKFNPVSSEKSDIFDKSIILGNNTSSHSLNKSRTLSEKSNTSVENYDPCPDFKPIVPLPDEVTVTTGEEEEISIFNARAKLFRFVDKQWKERGIGEIKLLKHKITGKVRVLMRRDQVLKICANHIITPEMDIQPMKNENKAYIWVANDFADENVALEKFCIRFKTTDIANNFYEVFQNSRKDALKKSIDSNSDMVRTKNNEMQKVTNVSNIISTPKIENQSSKTVLGGFTFSSTPTFKIVKDEKETPEPTLAVSKSISVNPFSNINLQTSTPFSNVRVTPNYSIEGAIIDSQSQSASNANTSDAVDQFEPNVEFKPIVPLPALVDQKTGEENEIILFEQYAKLLRFDSVCKEWKERGVGNIKLLANKENHEKVRLVMRREQIMKVCCNHYLSKDTNFQKMPNTDKAVSWCAKDFSDGEIITQTFCLRFKTAQLLNEFMEAVKLAKEKLLDNSTIIEPVCNITSQIVESSFGDKFKPKPGSWQCNTCYTNNLDNFLKCACCEQPRPTHEDSMLPTNVSSTWGDKFKSKIGSWECSKCYIVNEKESNTCNVCNNPKDASIIPEKDKLIEQIPKFNFGIDTKKNDDSNKSASTWGDLFKPKPNSWECQNCLVRNEGGNDQCLACNASKDGAIKEKTVTSFSNVSSQSKFNFGINQNKSTDSSIFDGTGAHKFTFGIPVKDKNESMFNSGLKNLENSNIFESGKVEEPSVPAGAMNLTIKNTQEINSEINKPALLLTPQKDNITCLGAMGRGTFDFVFKAKTTSNKDKTPVKSPKSDTENAGNESASEDEGHHLHFSPVIPMPDKVTKLFIPIVSL